MLSRIVELARGKNLAQLHPEMSDRVHLASLRSDQATYSPWSYLVALGDHESHVWVRKAVRIVSDAFCVLPVTIVKGGETIADHPALELLTNVNDVMSSVDLWRQWSIDMLLGGEEGWELVRGSGNKFVEIWPRQPHTIKITPDPVWKRYQRVANYTIDDGNGEPYTIPPDEFCFFKFYNPQNVWRGLAPISAVRNAIVIDTFAQAWSKLFFKKSARPDYAVIAPAGVTKTEREDLERELLARYGGFDNIYKPIVLEQGVTDLKVLDFPPKDLEWVQQRSLAREEIGAIFGVPDELMGWGRDTYENFASAHLVFFTITVLPLATHRDIHLTEFMQRVGILATDESIVTDTSNIAALKKDFGEKINQAAQLFAMGYPVNTINRALKLGLPEIDGGNVGYLPLSLVVATRSDPQPKALKASSKKEFDFGSAEHRDAFERFIKRLSKHEDRFAKMVGALFESQQEDVIKRLHAAKSFSRGLENIADNPFDKTEWGKRFTETSRPQLELIVQYFGDEALNDIGATIAFDVLDTRCIEFLKVRAQRFAKRVNDVTWEGLRESLRQGITDGEGIPQLERRVLEVMGERIRSSPETIARTEVVGASNGGTMLAWEQSGIVSGKRWLAEIDNRTRDSHVQAHNQIVGINDDFNVGDGAGPTPGQIGLAEEDINCRCSMVAVLGSRRSLPFSNNGHGKPKPQCTYTV